MPNLRRARLALLTLSLCPAAAPAETVPTGLPTSGIHSGDRAPPVRITCGDDSLALPCGTTANPLVISGGGGGGTTFNGIVKQGALDSTAAPWEVQLYQGGSAVASGNALPTADAGLDALIAGGKLPVSVTFPATQPVSEAAAPPGVATSANQTTQITAEQAIQSNTAARSGAWTDDSAAVTTTASTPVAASASRVGLHIWNVGTALACINWTSAATLSGSACGAGSVPIPAGSAYLEDQPGNVSPETISAIAVSATTLTIKVR